MFELTVESFGPTHRLIPPASPTFNSDVEVFHGLVEDEFYTAERFRTPEEFYGKAICYQVYFNLLRKNRNKNNRTPPSGGSTFDIRQGHFPNLSCFTLDNRTKSVYHIDNEGGLDEVFLFPEKDKAERERERERELLRLLTALRIMGKKEELRQRRSDEISDNMCFNNSDCDV